ncbi:MAG: glucose-1-phosphate adenylyltransferase subunit GlgD [Eubacteriales bacterium]|nr:glucose-1-phosphate adenylyltransferase subunit GlgD [Eubacteriales bacterium]MDD4583218.1 glucose-1-phosphate adenylyltransferase subunit GlgD [Eubacteriales bacterium]
MNILGIIFSYSDRENLRELTKRRTLASLPMAGKFRIIDFVVSNFVNDGIYDVSVIARNNYHSLMDHLGSGKEWDLIRKRGGLRVLTPYARSDNEKVGLYRGTIEALASNMHSIRRSMGEYVILSGSSILYSMDFNDLVEKHIQSNADITAVYTRDLNGFPTVPMGVSILRFNDHNRLYDMTINMEDMSQHGITWSTEVFVIRKSLLESLVADAIAYGRYDFLEDILKRSVNNLNIQGYEYKGHLLEFSSVAGYMQANMNFLNREFRGKAFKRPIYTKSKDSVPARYYEGCQVKNSIISDGCRIEGTIENSIISRDVRIGKGAVVKNSIIMQNTEIMKDVLLDHVILDKDVIVRENRRLSGHVTYPVVVEKASIV